MAISTDKLNRVTFFPIPYPTILVAFPLLVFAVWVVNIQCNNIVKSTQLTFIAEIFKEFAFVIFVILFFFNSASICRFFVSLLLTLIIAISKAFRLVWFATYQTFFGGPTCRQITFTRTIFTSFPCSYRTFIKHKFFSTMLTNKRMALGTPLCNRRIWIKYIPTFLAFSWFIHNQIIPCYNISVKNKIKYCQIARDRLRAVDTGVPVKEARAGQGALFE